LWTIVFSRQAEKDAKLLARNGLKKKTLALLQILQDNPFTDQPRYEKLQGDLAGFYSRRINLQHRMVYEVIKERQTVRILRMWTHYE
jgi:Txe/YoeB family toxin of toxin-antitoxin system